ncbi:MAG: glycogen debranching protein GlgX [Eubacteriales bacterium]|nr:glycogen debranching protein GlgX [Eubacteriales bacterium]
MNWNDLTTLVNYESFARGLGHNLVPLDEVNGFKIRPGFFLENGAVVIPGGVSFTVHSQNAKAVSLVLFRREACEPYAIIPYPQNYRIGYVYSMIVFGLDIEEFEYAFSVDGEYRPGKGLLFNPKQFLIDPYSKAVTGQSRWGERKNDSCHYKSRVVANDFDWGNSRDPQIPMDDLIIYELHVRGFTFDPSSGVKYPGTFAGLADKIPYLQELGVNAVELMPIFEFDEMRDVREYKGNHLLDYWGYNPVSFFAPNTGYTAGIEYNREGIELKQLIRQFHENGIEVILDVVFNHTAEGNENGPVISFKGFDNNVYYMLSPDGQYYNFSGCGNTLNCNHPVVQQMILECLRYWVTEYRIDGFRFDLASILGRNEDGSPMSKPPLLQSLAFDPILANVKLIAEAWDAGGLYQVGSFPSWSRWSEWNGRYRDDMRCFLKGDPGLAMIVADRLAGSHDLYDPLHRGKNASVNFITCHDGFTLHDLYSYNSKHNEANGWGNSDGDNHNNSWNCGTEGETGDPQINELRKRLIRNVFTALLCSRGTPMLLAGDEFGNSQGGNNNAYCQDNQVSWLNWSDLDKNRDLFNFVQQLIQFRRLHPAMRNHQDASRCGLPSFSKHGVQAWYLDPNPETHLVAVMFTGYDATKQRDDIIYLAINSHWETQTVALPRLPGRLRWHLAIDTTLAAKDAVNLEQSAMKPTGPTIKMIGRSIIVLVGQ